MISNPFPFTDFETFGMPQTRTEVLEQLQADAFSYQQFLALTEPLQQDFLAFCMGTKGAKLTYDPFFKRVFDPQRQPHRLEEFLSLCLGEKLSIVAVLPNESERLSEEGDIKKVYTVVLIQSSSQMFHLFPDQYLHHARQIFDTGLPMDLIQEYLIIPLDIFLKCPHNKLTKLDAWLYFIASDDPADIMRVIRECPDFKELYREVFQFRFMTKELVSMFSEGLRLLDAGTVQYMIEDQQAQIEQLQQQLKKQQEQTAKAMAEIEAENARLKALLAK